MLRQWDSERHPKLDQLLEQPPRRDRVPGGVERTAVWWIVIRGAAATEAANLFPSCDVIGGRTNYQIRLMRMAPDLISAQPY